MGDEEATAEAAAQESESPAEAEAPDLAAQAPATQDPAPPQHSEMGDNLNGESGTFPGQEVGSHYTSPGHEVGEEEENPLLIGAKEDNPPSEPQDASSALSDEPQIDIFSFKYFGYLPQYFAVGILYQGLPSTVYGLFLGYLNTPAYVYSTALTIVSLPWSFKFFIGTLSDCVPILGLRRKPYIVFGWSLCAVMLIWLALTPLPPPYFCVDGDGKYIMKIEDENGDTKPAPPCNAESAELGGKYAVMMCVAALGYVIADVAADGLTVEFARTEPINERGYTQSTIYMVRTAGQVVAVVLVGVFMNGYEYNGSFDWGLSFNSVCAVMAVPSIIMVPVSWFGIPEVARADEDRDTFTEYAAKVWQLLTGKAMFFVLVYQFCTPVVGSISTTAAGHVKMEWAGVKNLQNQMFSLFGLALFGLGLWLVRRHLLNESWRMLLAVTSIVLILLDAFFAYMTIFDVVRNQYFYLGETVLYEIPAAANFVVGTFVIVEMATDGTEGIVYGLVTTAHNLGHPVGRAIANQLYRLFTPSLSAKDAYIEDDESFRRVVAWSFALSYFFGLASLCFLFFLPNQKSEAQQRKQTWDHHVGFAYTVVITMVLAMVYALTVNFMSMHPSTMCLEFAGGDGCAQDDEPER